MANGVELGKAYVSIIATSEKIAPQIKRDFGVIDAEAGRLEKSLATRLGTKLQGALKTTLKVGAGALAGLAATVVGMAAKGGIDRALKIDAAQKKLTGLGHDTEAVDAIMKNALASVKGTAFGLGEAATVAAGAVAAGVQPGERLEAVLKSVANSAAAAGVDMGEMGGIFNKVASLGKAQNDVLHQVADKGIPIYQALGKQMGMTAEEVFRAASKGQISFEQFEAAMRDASGTVAQEMGNTLPGRFANFRASLARVGEQVVSRILPHLADGFAWLTEKTDQLGPVASRVGEAISDGISGAVTWVRDVFAPAVQEAAQRVRDDLVPALQDMVTWVKENSTWIAPLAAAVASGSAAWYGYGGALKALKTASGGFTAALGGITSAIKGIGAAISANPFGAVVAVVAAAVGALIWFFTQTETGRQIVEQAWGAIQNAVAVVSDWFANTFAPAMGAAWEGIKAAAQPVVDWFGQHVAPVFQALGELVRAVWESIVKPTLAALAATCQALWNNALQPAFTAIAEAWSVLWAGVQAVWGAVGPPLMAIIGGAFQGMQAVIGGVMQAIGAVITTVWNVIRVAIETALGVITGIIRTATGIISGDWSKVWSGISTVFSSIWNGIRSAAESIINGLIGYLKGTWNAFSGFWSSMWEGIKTAGKSAWDWISTTLGGVWTSIESAAKSAWDAIVTTIGGAWNKIKSTVATPINVVIGFINEGIIGSYNWVADKLKIIPRIEGKIAKVALARGGILPGTSSWRNGDDQMVWMRRGEGVTVSEALRDPYERKRLLALNKAVLSGTSPERFRQRYDLEHHATGGIIGFRGHRFTSTFASRILQAEKIAGAQMHITQGGWRPRTSYSGTSHAGDALDITGSYQRFIAPLRKVGIATWDRAGKGNWVAHAHGVPLPGHGTAGGSAIWQAQDYLRGGDGLGGRDNGPRVAIQSADIEEAVKKGADKAWWEKLADAVGDTWDKIKGWFSEVADMIAGPLRKLQGLVTGDGPFDNLVGKLAEKLGKDLKNWVAKKLGLPTDDGYATGTRHARPGWAWVGENGPELVNFRGGEQVLTAQESRAAMGGMNVTLNMPRDAFRTAEDLFAFLQQLPTTVKRMGGVIYG